MIVALNLAWHASGVFYLKKTRMIHSNSPKFSPATVLRYTVIVVTWDLPDMCTFPNPKRVFMSDKIQMHML